MRRALLNLALATFAVLGAALFAPAQAHTRSQSYSVWTTDGAAIEFTFEVDARRVTQLAQLDEESQSLEALLGAHLETTIQATQRGRACAWSARPEPVRRDSVLVANGGLLCPGDVGAAPVRITITAFQTVSPTHIHLARYISGADARAFVLREGNASLELDGRQAPSGFSGFISAGFLHVVSGVDHAAFLLALFLAAGSLSRIAWCVTGFTAGHTLSLALAGLGAITPDEPLIEALIGFTIAVAAIEAGGRIGLNRRLALMSLGAVALLVFAAPIGLRAPVLSAALGIAAYAVLTAQVPGKLILRLTPAISIAFGLIHGAGFAGGLEGLGLAPHEIFLPLLGFNIGVEFAQMAFIGAIFVLAFAAGRLLPSAQGLTAQITGAALAGLGLFWFASRVWL